jgi:phosphinothricin acetyltransferase
MDASSFTTRPAIPDDAAAITSIYNQGIRGRGATFETRERTSADVLEWFDDPRFPILVAVEHGAVVGWAAASAYRARACYAGVAEYSIYVANSHHGRGVGTALMPAFLQAVERAGFWKVLSRLFPENGASRALCARHGFREVGVYRRHAKLDGAWRDVVIVERLLRDAERAGATANQRR